ncbi:hypothetical protein GCM10023189_17430 [Nibrella saemangeumensis]|uniref:Uncharacterized protein n=1 Tax=Nibrella saemangeumensis TaxID=1084526 RepID=A0ABP8MPS1_9BACT
MRQTLTVFADIITEYDVLIDIIDSDFYYFYVRIRLTDGTLLYAREYVNWK